MRPLGVLIGAAIVSVPLLAVPGEVAAAPADPIRRAYSQELTDPVPTDYETFGESLAIDGDTLVVGDPYDGQGAVHVFVRSGADGTWSHQQTLTDATADPSDLPFFGAAVAIEGHILVVGAPGDDRAGPDRGAVHVFRRGFPAGPDPSGAVWASDTAIIDGFGDDGERLGAAVAVDGSTVVAGAPLADIGGPDRGAILVASADGATVHRMHEFPGGSDGMRAGTSVAIDGGTIAVGAPRLSGGVPPIWGGEQMGAVFVLTETEPGWAKVRHERLSDDTASPYDRFGESVAIDGDTIVAGAPDDSGWGEYAGAVHVLRRSPSNGIWYFHQELFNPSAVAREFLGHAVAIDGETIVAGAPYGESERGSVHVFWRDPSASDFWSHSQRLVVPDAADWEAFGEAVAAGGGTVVAAAPHDDGAGTDRGAVHVFAHGAFPDEVLALPLPIPDDTTPFDVPIFVSDPHKVVDVDVALDVGHPRVADLTVTLEHDDTGISITLIDRPGFPDAGCPNADIAAVLSDEASEAAEDACANPPPALGGRLAPLGALDAFDGIPARGNWRLSVVDGVDGEAGWFHGWELRLQFDESPPVLSLPEGVVVESGVGGAQVRWAASAVDAIDGSRPVTCIPGSGSFFSRGVTAVTCAASDSSGNTATSSFPVTVEDTTAPDVFVNVPADNSYVVVGSTVIAEFFCVDVDPAGCAGTVPWGAAIDTSPGAHDFTVTAWDGSGNSATVTHRYTAVEACDGRVPTLVVPPGGARFDGTPGDDVILGSEGADIVYGLGGDDLVCGRGGDDVILGGPGSDTLLGGDGNDKLRGAAGDDTLRGGAGSDRLLPETGHDVVNGGAGSDIADYLVASGPVSANLSSGTSVYTPAGGGAWFHTLVLVEKVDGSRFGDTLVGDGKRNVLRGKRGDDTILGEAGDDDLIGGLGGDRIQGGDGADLVKGQGGDDTLGGGGGPDRLVGGAGSDTLDGGPGDDTLIGGLRAHFGAFSNHIDGGRGIDDCRWEFDGPVNCE